MRGKKKKKGGGRKQGAKGQNRSMRPSLPRLEDYDLSPLHGFLPEEPPLELLPDAYYSKWETIVRNLQGLLLSRRLRGVVEVLPVLSAQRLRTEPEWRRAYSILAFISHAYIWGGDGPAEVRYPQPTQYTLIGLTG